MVPRKADAWVVTAVIAVASLATSMLSRGKQAKAAALVQQANFQLLTSISREVGVINTSMQLALIELRDIRNELDKTPAKTVALDSHQSMIALWRNYQKKLTAFIDEENQFLTEKTYYGDLKVIMTNYQFFRDKLISVSPEASYEYAMHVAMAQELETMIAIELTSDEAVEAQVGYDLAELKVALKDGYLPYLEAAINPDVPNSLESTLRLLESKVDQTRKLVSNNPVQKFFESTNSGAVTCRKTRDITFYNDFTCSPTVDVAIDDGCDPITVIEYTLRPLHLNKSTEVISDGIELVTGVKSYGTDYSYDHSVENIVLNQHKMADQICGGSINNSEFSNIDTQHFPAWEKVQGELNSDAIKLESLRQAVAVCKLAISNINCRITLLETGELTCGE